MITFGFLLLPAIGFIGAAVDYSRANAARTTMQTAIDSTALMLSKEAQSLTTAQLQTRANAIFAALYNRSDTNGIVITPTFTKPANGSFQLQLTGQGTIDTAFFRALKVVGLGKDTVTFNVTSQVLWGMKKLELALALDNTGSMASNNKMTELKKAAKSLIDTFQAASSTAGDIKISIIPFATDVNVGKTNVSANWIGWDEWDEENGNDVSTTTCTNRYGRRMKCTTSSSWVPDNHNTWNGCVWDRDKPYDVQNTAPSTSVTSTLFPAHQADNCPVQMMTLSSDWTAMRTKIDSMTPTGATNVTIGLQMAFQTLTNAAPFNAAAPSTDLDKVIILLTDGDNTENRWDEGWGAAANIDARTRLACGNVKAANIKLYTVRVIDGNATLLKDCATKPDMYYDVDNATQLNAVFGAIAKNLANLRIAK